MRTTAGPVEDYVASSMLAALATGAARPIAMVDSLVVEVDSVAIDQAVMFAKC